jgi:hypothetical protein
VFLENGDLLIGRVLSMAGKPIAGARVMATGSRPIAGSTANTPLPAPVIAMVDGVAETEADGGFSLVLSNPPATAIYVTKTGYVEQRRIIDSVEMMRHVEIRLQPANAGIFGRVLDFSDNPVRKFSISLASQGMPGTNAYTRTFEDKEGRFSVRDVAPGVYMLVVHADYRIANTLRFGQVEIREGLMYGVIVMHFPKANIK